MTSRNEKITKFLYDLKNGGEFRATEEDTAEIEDLLREVLQTGLVRLEKENFRLTSAGMQLTNQGKTYADYLRAKALETFLEAPIGQLITGSRISYDPLPKEKNQHNPLSEKQIKQVVKQAQKIIATVNADAALSTTDKKQALAVLTTLVSEINNGQMSESTYQNLIAISGQINSISTMIINLLPFIPKPPAA